MATLLTRTHGDVLIAYFQDVRIIDESRIVSLGQELMELTSSGKIAKIVLNFQNVSFMSSAMIGKLIQFGKKCQSADIKLRLSNINDNVQQVFDLMKLGKVFKVDETEEKAIEAFEKKGWFGG
jgi:anti-sigma B factor antagonist